MNTNEFTERAMADPWDQDLEFIEALNSDPQHRELLNELQAFDRLLKTALQVEVPEGLAERIKEPYLEEYKVFERHLKSALEVAVPEGLADRIKEPYLEAYQVFDHQLKSAMEVDVPEGLADRIKAKHLDEYEAKPIEAASNVVSMTRKTEQAPKKKPQAQQPMWRFAMAASLALSVGLAGFLGLKLYKAEHQLQLLETAVLQHSYHEPASWTNRSKVRGNIVNAAFLGFGGKTTHVLEQVTHATRCHLEDHDGVHLVVIENGRPVTVYFMYKEVVKREVTMRDRRFDGIMMPGNERGAWAAVVERGTALEDARNALNKVRSAVEWRL